MQHAGKKGPTLIPLAAARANAFKADWAHYAPPVPTFIGRREIRNVDLRELAPLIDWAPFFQTWELSGPYPAILDDPVVGEAARNVLRRRTGDAEADRRRPLAHGERRRRAAARRTPIGDDIEIYADEARDRVALTWHNLRQQNERPAGQAELLPRRFRRAEGVRRRGLPRRVRGHRRPRHREASSPSSRRAKDDYSAIMLKALADRLAEAFAEWLHRKVRRELWGYAADEALDAAALIDEEYRGIRPAPGYPACPDHAVKAPLFELLRATEIGMTLTESFAMLPGRVGIGFYFAHPEATYFAVGTVGDDQAADFARRAQGDS